MKRYVESYITRMKYFAQNIRENTAPSVIGVDGRSAVSMGMAAKKPYLAQRPVQLSEITAPLPAWLNLPLS
jgi:hypothetical protein